MRRRAFLGSLTAAANGGLWARYVEPAWFELTRTEVRVAGAPSFRMMHVSDIHMSDGMTAPDLEEGFALGLAERPDLICLTGDFVSNTEGFDVAGLGRMLRRAVDTAPTFAVLGNHDGGQWLKRHGGDASINKLTDLLQEAGVTLLHNRTEEWRGVRFVGLGDIWAGGFEPQTAFPARTAAKMPTIVLCHNPDGKDGMSHLDWDLMLSGHTHGGQAKIPGVTPYWAPVADKRFVSGLYAWEGRQLFITRGLGSPKHVRVLCRPEVSVLEVGDV